GEGVGRGGGEGGGGGGGGARAGGRGRPATVGSAPTWAVCMWGVPVWVSAAAADSRAWVTSTAYRRNCSPAWVSWAPARPRSTSRRPASASSSASVLETAGWLR